MSTIVPTSETARKLTFYDLRKFLTIEEIAGLISDLPAQEAYKLKYDYEFWARPTQRLPQGNWRVWFLKGGRGSGKALALDTLVPTPDGFTTMGAVQVGDTVFDENGKPCTVTFVTDVMYGHQCYEVEFSDGSSVVADAEHLWITQTKLDRKRNRIGSVKTTKQIRDTLMYGDREINHSIDCTKPVQCAERALPIHPYMLGVWLGDGTSTKPEIACNDVEIISYIQSVGYKATRYGVNSDKCPQYGISSVVTSDRRGNSGQFASIEGNFSSELRKLHLYDVKYIPVVYMRASYEQRLNLLMGLMDSDGYIAEGGACEFTTTSEILARQVYELICSLGMKTRITEGVSKLNGIEYGTKYRLHFTPYTPVFRLKRKLERQHFNGAQMLRQTRRYIVAVRSVDSTPVRCITVDSPNHMYLFGKSFIPTHNTWTGSKVVNKWAKTNGRILIVARTAYDARDTMIEGESGLLAVAPKQFRPEYEPSKRRLTWPNGAIALIRSADEPDSIRGPQFHKAWGDELASWRYGRETWDNIMFALRLGLDPQMVVTSTPRPTKLVKDILKLPGTIVTTDSTYANVENLAPQWATDVIARYAGTRTGLQELEGRVLDDNPDALWTRSNLDKYRVNDTPDLDEIVVAVDPMVAELTAKEIREEGKVEKDNRETGIVVVGRAGIKGDMEAHGYTLDDMSLNGTPLEWANMVVTAYHKYRADRVVAEANNGGALVKATINTVDPNIPVELVYASRGKLTRAEPVSNIYAQGRGHHMGLFPQLEDQFCEWQPGMPSPDRLDAAVWGYTYLMVDPESSRIAVVGD